MKGWFEFCLVELLVFIHVFKEKAGRGLCSAFLHRRNSLKLSDYSWSCTWLTLPGQSQSEYLRRDIRNNDGDRERAWLRVRTLREGILGGSAASWGGSTWLTEGRKGYSWHKVKRMAPDTFSSFTISWAGPGGKEMAGHVPLTDHRLSVLEKNLEII